MKDHNRPCGVARQRVFGSIPACFICLGNNWRDVKHREHPDPDVRWICNVCHPPMGPQQ